MGAPEETVGVRAPGVVARRALYERLSAGVSAGVTLVSAPPGSGKTVLIRSWIEEAGLRARTAWVLVERHERDAQRFWLSIVERLRFAVGRDGLVQKLEPTPEFDGEGLVRRLISELDALDEPVVLVIDDLHELVSPDAQAQLELLLAQRPPLLFVVLATRHDPSLGLHRLRLAGELTELRAVDLRLSAEEARQLLDASGVELSAEAAALLLAGPRDGRRACGSPRCRSPVTLTPSSSSPSSLAASGRWRTICSPKSSSASPKGSGSSCSGPRFWSGSAACSPTA